MTPELDIIATYYIHSYVLIAIMFEMIWKTRTETIEIDFITG